MTIKAISTHLKTCFYKNTVVKKTKIETAVASNFAQIRVFSDCAKSSSEQLRFSSKHSLLRNLKDHFRESVDLKYIEVIAAKVADKTLTPSQLEDEVSKVMIELKFPISEYAIIYRDRATEVLRENAIPIEEIK